MASKWLILQGERHDLKTEAEAISTAAASRDYTDEERVRLDAIETRLETVNRDLEREERIRQATLTAEIPTPSPTVTSLGGLHDNAQDRPWGYELGVRYVQQADGTRALGGRPNAAYVALGACLQAGYLAATGQQVPDVRFRAAASGGNTGDPAAGGFSVGTDVSNFLWQMAEESSILLPYCTPITISADSDGIEAPYVTNTSRATGSRFGGVRVYRRSEAATVAASYPEEEKFSLQLADIMGIAYQTDRMIQDAGAVGQLYGNAFRSEFAFVIDDEIINGNGVGQCQGVLNSPALITVSKETGQASGTIVSENLSKMYVRLPARSKPRAIWFVNGETGPQFDALSIAVGTGALEPRFVSYGPDGLIRIKGRPIVELEQCAALGTVGDVILADLSEYIVIRKGGLEQASSDHVRFIYNERTFRWVMRINGKSPWRAAVTPYKGSASLSPFVVLATR